MDSMDIDCKENEFFNEMDIAYNPSDSIAENAMEILQNKLRYTTHIQIPLNTPVPWPIMNGFTKMDPNENETVKKIQHLKKRFKKSNHYQEYNWNTVTLFHKLTGQDRYRRTFYRVACRI